MITGTLMCLQVLLECLIVLLKYIGKAIAFIFNLICNLLKILLKNESISSYKNITEVIIKNGVFFIYLKDK